jgi:hypothetical protein
MNRTGLLLTEMVLILGAVLLELWAVAGLIIHSIQTAILLTFIAVILLTGWLLVRQARFGRSPNR